VGSGASPSFPQINVMVKQTIESHEEFLKLGIRTI
jgi:hypothetical protein